MKEQDSKTLRWDHAKLRHAMKLYAVTDSAWLKGRSLADCVKEALAGGATFVQLREKRLTTEERVSLAQTIKPLCARAHVPFVIDDDVEAAQRACADGVHVGQTDAACAEARRILGPRAIIGVSASTLEDALKAQEQGADYLGVGAIFGTPTKPDADLVSYATLRQICDAVSIPVVAIGGLNAQTISQLAGSGVDGVAVVSAIFAASDITASTRKLMTIIDQTLDL